MKPNLFEVSLEVLVNALFPTKEERMAFAERYFTTRKGVLSRKEAVEYLGIDRANGVVAKGRRSIFSVRYRAGGSHEFNDGTNLAPTICSRGEKRFPKPLM